MNEELMKDLHTMLGRLNGIHAAVVLIAQRLPPDCARAAAKDLRASEDPIEAGALASPIPDVQLNEFRRVRNEIAHQLEWAAAQSR